MDNEEPIDYYTRRMEECEDQSRNALTPERQVFWLSEAYNYKCAIVRLKGFGASE